MKKVCKMCASRTKDWEGSDPECAFPDGAVYCYPNWNCATVNAIRDICYEGQGKMPPGVHYQYCDDMKYATIKIDDIEPRIGMALWVSWYKNRGGTDAMWILESNALPGLPGESDCLTIIEHFKDQKPR